MSQLINRGGFGCIYKPALACDGTSSKNNNLVTKLQLLDFNSLNELEIGNLIKQIDNYLLFYIPVIDSCNIHLASIDKNIVKQCSNISSKSNKEYILMNMNYIKNIPFFTFLTDLTKPKQEIISNIIETYTYLLQSIKLLVDISLVHFDLKSENILYNSNTLNPLLIDFGLSINIDSLTDENMSNYFYIYAPDYYIWPLEVHIINFLLHKTKDSLTLTNLQEIIAATLEHNIALQIFSDEFINKYGYYCENYFKQYVGNERNSTIKDLIKHYNTWDNYSLSILYLRLLTVMFNNQFFDNKFIVLYSQLLLENIDPNPTKRHSIKTTRELFNNLFYVDEKFHDYARLLTNFTPDYGLISKGMMHDVSKLKRKKK